MYWKAVTSEKVLYKSEQRCKQPLGKHLETVAATAILNACLGLLQLQTPPCIQWSSPKHPTPVSRTARPPSVSLESRQRCALWILFLFWQICSTVDFFLSRVQNLEWISQQSQKRALIAWHLTTIVTRRSGTSSLLEKIANYLLI